MQVNNAAAVLATIYEKRHRVTSDEVAQMLGSIQPRY